MLSYLQQESNMTHTENGGVTHLSTGSACLDLFSTIGALRTAEEEEITNRFLRAYTEDPDLAMKALFFSRDIRGGIGERRVFRVILRWLASHEAQSVKRNISHISEYGRWDDLLTLLDTPCEKAVLYHIKQQFMADCTALETDGSLSLLAKWLPSVNASNRGTIRQGKKIARSMSMTDAQYRKTLTALRKQIRILENHLREKDYTFDYGKQPSKAMFKYRAAFLRNDGDRYGEYLDKVAQGEAKLHAGTLMPYELVAPCLNWNHYTDRNRSFLCPMSQEEQAALNATWSSLPDFTNGENALAVVDTSGSMYFAGNPLPAAVALSLGLYFAERNTGIFRNHFIEFSRRPQLIQLKGETFVDRLRYAASFNEVADTNLEAVFDLILSAALRHEAPQEELPSTLYLVSDMEFNSCVVNAGASNFENAKRKFAAHGYQLPKIVFWNVQSRNQQQPVSQNEQGVALVSGCSPRLFQMITSGRTTPFSYMMEILGSERYALIAA